VTYAQRVLLVTDLIATAKARLDDAEVLAAAARFDGSVYLCGYAVEIALKARICKSLAWAGYPATRNEFQGYASFRTHDLDVLLHISGVEPTIKASYLPEWSTVAQWDPEVRYRAIGSATAHDAVSMVAATKTLLGAL
jgi:hypothetical protein